MSPPTRQASPNRWPSAERRLESWLAWLPPPPLVAAEMARPERERKSSCGSPLKLPQRPQSRPAKCGSTESSRKETPSQIILKPGKEEEEIRQKNAIKPFGIIDTTLELVLRNNEEQLRM